MSSRMLINRLITPPISDFPLSFTADKFNFKSLINDFLLKTQAIAKLEQWYSLSASHYFVRQWETGVRTSHFAVRYVEFMAHVLIFFIKKILGFHSYLFDYFFYFLVL